MGWLEEMNQAAATVAFPSEGYYAWEHREDDVITVTTEWSDAMVWSEYTAESAEFIFHVRVVRGDGSDEKSRTFRDEEAAKFWADLMAHPGTDRGGELTP